MTATTAPAATVLENPPAAPVAPAPLGARSVGLHWRLLLHWLGNAFFICGGLFFGLIAAILAATLLGWIPFC